MSRIYAGAALPLIVALCTTPAFAGLVTEPLGVFGDVDLEVSMVGTTLTVSTSNGVLLNHNDTVNCVGAGTTTVTCTMVDHSEVRGGGGDDTFTVSLEAPTNPHQLRLRGKAGDDVFEVVRGEGGSMTMQGDKGSDSYTFGTAAAPLAIDSDTRIWTHVGLNNGNDPEDYSVHVDLEGFLQANGSKNDDTFDVSGTVTRTANVFTGLELKGNNGADTFDIDVSDVTTTYHGGSRAIVSFDGGDGPDYFTLAGPVTAEDAVFALTAGPGDDMFDLDDHAFSAVATSGEATVNILGEGGADSLLNDTATHTTTGSPATITFASW